MATKIGLGGGSSNKDLLYRKYKRAIKSLIFLPRVNNVEHNIKQNIYTGMEVISLIPP